MWWAPKELFNFRLLSRPYVFAVLTVGAATLLRGLLDPILHNEHALFLYYGALAATAWHGGWGPAIFSLVSGYLLADWFFLPPRKELSVFTSEPAHLVGASTFVSSGLIIAAFSEAPKERNAERKSVRDWLDSAVKLWKSKWPNAFGRKES
jgi:K+-sensing histidine kinase KdpD